MTANIVFDMETTESIKSDRSRRSKHNHNNNINTNNHNNNSLSHHRSRHSHRSQTNQSSKKSNNSNNTMTPYHNITDDSRIGDGQEIIEVQILPQDENWGENTTAITGNTSEQSISMEDINANWNRETESGFGFVCRRYIESAFSLMLGFVSFFSPIAMVTLPKLGFFASSFDNAELNPIVKTQLLSCSSECKGLLVSLTARLVLLALGLWALFLRRPIATMPRIFLFRATIMLLILISTFSYWLFYIVQVTNSAKIIVEGGQAVDYKSLVNFATNFVDTLLFIHYTAVVLLELRHQQPTYYIKITRSPDGASQSYSIGQLSIQRAAVCVLQKYYIDFPIYNPYLERIPISKSQRNKQINSSFKYYDVDNVNSPQQQSQSRAVLAANARRRDSSHNERFYEEHEYQRRVQKRRARLITAAEEAFTHIKRVHNEPAPSHPLDPHEAAQAVFPSMARALQKYLRVTRQQPRHTFESILKHLAHCLKHDLSPRAFLEPYLMESPILQNEKERRDIQSWSLVCDELLSRPIKNGSTFQLIQNDVSLIAHIYKLPHFNISEEVVDPKSNKFVLKLNSETSV